MRLRPIVFACCLLLTTRSLHAQRTGVNGTLWKGLSASDKMLFISGHVGGAMVIGENVATEAFAQAATETPKGDPGVEAAGRTLFDGLKLYHERVSRYFKNASGIEQIVGGIDTFYGDFRNLKIEVPEALWVVLLQLDGAPDPKIQQEIDSLRAKAR